MDKGRYAVNASTISDLSVEKAREFVAALEEFALFLAQTFDKQVPVDLMGPSWDEVYGLVREHIADIEWEAQADLLHSCIGKTATVFVMGSQQAMTGRLLDITPDCCDPIFMVVDKTRFIDFSVIDIHSVVGSTAPGRSVVILVKESGGITPTPKIQRFAR